jgi:hypothetical protein
MLARMRSFGELQRTGMPLVEVIICGAKVCIGHKRSSDIEGRLAILLPETSSWGLVAADPARRIPTLELGIRSASRAAAQPQSSAEGSGSDVRKGLVPGATVATAAQRYSCCSAQGKLT